MSKYKKALIKIQKELWWELRESINDPYTSHTYKLKDNISKIIENALGADFIDKLRNGKRVEYED